MNQIRIAFVASTFVVGGAERVVADVITGLGDGFDAQLFFLRDAGPMGRPLLRSGIEGVEQLAPHRFDPRGFTRVTAAFRRFSPDIVFCLDHHNAMLFGRAAGVAAGVRAQVVGSHSTGLYGRSRNFTLADRVLMGFTDRVVAVSSSHADYLCEHEGISRSKVVVIENGVDLDRYAADETARRDVRTELGLEDGDHAVMMVAALRPEKAHEALIEAAGNAAPQSRTRWYIVGDGPRRAELEALVDRAGLGDRVRFLGVRQDVARLLQGADVVVLPSHPVVETLPLSLLEAMASGVPVVASRVGSIPDLVDDGENGLLIRPADAGELAAAIDRILGDTTLRAQMSAAARATVEKRYSIGRMRGRYTEMFERLVA